MPGSKRRWIRPSIRSFPPETARIIHEKEHRNSKALLSRLR